MIKLVFDSKLWNGKDEGDNSQFWKPAKILSTDGNHAKVRFLHNGRISEGHFLEAMRPLERSPVLKKTITYEDFNGEKVVEDFFFHLSKAELVELEMSHRGGLSEALQRIIASEDNQSIVQEFKNIILTSYGKRSEDGRRFIKNQELRDEFVSTEAYSTLFMELVTDTDAAVEFINGIIPAGMAEEAAEVAKTVDKPTLEEVSRAKIVTRKQIHEMSPEEASKLGERLQSGEIVIAE